MTKEEQYREDLTRYLLEVCTGNGYLKGTLLETEDIDSAYKDWQKYKNTPYSFFQGERKFDDMDDHITDTILKDRRHSVDAMQSTAASAHHFLMRRSVEPGTAEAYRLFLITVEVMYKIGASIELCRLGYKFERL